MPDTSPSGEQIEISHGSQTAVAVTVGGGVRTYTSDGHDVLDGYARDAMADGARAQTLVPWPNRVRDGKWTWDGNDLQLALTEPEQHNAIHGLVRWMPWDVAERSESSVALVVTTYPQPGYPWTLRVRNDISLGDDGLTVRTEITNLSSTSAPVAAGSHPYITAGTPTVDDAVLHIPADTWIPTGDQQIPTGQESVEGTELDFRSPRPIGSTQIDYAFTDLHRGEDGRFRLVLATPDGGRRVTFWVDEAYPFVEVFTGDALPDEGRRRQGLGVEPMSAPPNGLPSGEDLVVLAPGNSWAGHWGVTPA